ncbi:glycosyltransferase family 2 protein [Bifidobacterium pseudolongum]|uniref:glycosyltransferase family 2 protein n=1 Tax=Bifidobacterium pseudolongum TaxID=1694 RepID=UPI00101F29EA|nr:glycosyltransferase [Bifidobacterium pseudolongum]RYP99405.1 glycosyl transferase family 2 [Bifidobacterium pseudolongum subsp. globosum]RYQ11538.1 glycosyl transferase family 2 [Bifidobacterium pseudolongum subsp. globosum]
MSVSEKVVLSVIVPVHNVERFLPRLFRSLEQQDLHQAEVLFVDDGSTDASGILLDEVKHHDHFRVKHQRNEGVAAARNLALDMAQGDYVCFVDPDDDISAGYIASLRDAAVRTGADMLVTDWWECRPDKTIPMSLAQCLDDSRQLSSEAVCRLILQSDVVLGSLWAKAFARRLFEGNRFPPQRTCSDFVPCITALVDARKVVYVPRVHYSYTVSRGGSLQNSKSKQDLSDFVDVHTKAARLITQHYPALQPSVRFDLLRSRQQACMSICTSSAVARNERRLMFRRFKKGLLSSVPFMWKSNYPVKGKIMFTIVACGYAPTVIVMKIKAKLRGKA